MNFNEWVKDYFTFTRKERIGLIAIIIIIVAIWLSPKTFSGKSKIVPVDTSWITAVKKLQHKQNTSPTNSEEIDESANDVAYDKPASHTKNLKADLFYFDPNTLSTDGWKK